MKLLLKIYKNSISPVIKFLFPSGGCRFYPQEPSCSEYFANSVEKYGIFRGGLIGIKRVIKCNNWF